MDEFDEVTRETESAAVRAACVTHPLRAVPRGVEREPHLIGVRIDAQTRRGRAGCVRVQDQGLRPAERRDADASVLAGVRLVAFEVIALERVEDLGERSLDVGGVQVRARVGDGDGARGVRAVRLVHVAVEPAEEGYERRA
jgi:hypothetical protein